MAFERETFFGLHFEPRHDGERHHVIPVQNLIQALEGLQRTIHLVAMMREGREVRTRARVTRDIEERFQLHCEIPEEGSYYQPTFIAEKDQSLFSLDEAAAVAELTRSLLKSVATGDEEDFRKAVVDSAFRTPLLSSLGKMFGGQGGHYRLSVEDRSGHVIVDSLSAINGLERLRLARLSPDTHSIVTGYFTKIDFKERKLSLLIPSTGRLISCLYVEEIEPALLENARDLIQVVGTIELDEDGNPQRITDVQEVHPVNTDDIDLIELLPDYLKSNELNNLRVTVELSEDKQTYFGKLDDLGINQAAYTRSDLIEALEAEIDFLWKNVAREDDDNLAPKAQLLKSRLRTLFKEYSE
ncbi:hypothetical protein [Rhizobium sp. AAP43]|uniref:hypothetical protein n=1 Tax=Rhizobium sp. AAP43 TaxID=1523420 RepID=UPI0006B9C58B|nr:hypothetical protein [Rhizobium sp. AAP43]KPF46164.1 hypothetical protein IP76_04410 [Rhizobium sp. AAP43]